MLIQAGLEIRDEDPDLDAEDRGLVREVAVEDVPIRDPGK